MTLSETKKFDNWRVSQSVKGRYRHVMGLAGPFINATQAGLYYGKTPQLTGLNGYSKSYI
jgi:hypothetical protein